MIKTTLSIILSAYNVSKYISKTILSLANQTKQDFQVIAIDDRSTDDTLAILKRFEQEYDWLKVISHEENLGVSSVRNTGIQAANTKYITFIDGDDWLEPTYVEYFLNKFIEDPELDLISCGFFIDNQNGKSKPQSEKKALGKVTRDEAIRQIIKMNGVVMGYTWNKMYRLELIKEHELTFLTDLALMEDQLFNVEYATVANNFYLSKMPLYHYVSRKDSLTRKFDVENVKNVSVATLKVYKTIYQNSKEERQERENQ
ncbi:glycosyltransferase family 2 protein [Companilactobacillus furfuricola]|uniref:glycosyltransferase family 2 protein n=1 Tax=Companilactobacillus furfuricola TaxID=1462575 RepID=UPI000F797FE8|nr:glycosyltransferase family 2 protein [Companilactobacillus furfuricola]